MSYVSAVPPEERSTTEAPLTQVRFCSVGGRAADIFKCLSYRQMVNLQLIR